ncbi:hypothetical protein GCM10017559_06260 [Streptosporangium longisporum]|uniref:OmpR/PhoB-type domain-containing protein n=1 Tax=Streptosporangium longisporum TaxID=46187 RepID=A0ABN3XSR6_9ACTN
MDTALSFRVLGPLEVLVGERRVSIGGARQRITLATLVLRAGRVVPVDLIAEAIWGEHPPPTARRQVIICVSGLRRAFQEAGAPPDLLVTSPPGYVLQAGPDDVDVLLAERLATKARAAEAEGDLTGAARWFAEACDLWRGPALAGIESAFAEAEARRLDDRHLTLTEERVQLELALGRHRELIDDLAVFVDANPLRERLRAQLMLARYRCGRRAEALDTYRIGRAQMVGELGIEPGTELQALHDAILRDDPELAAPSAPPARVTASTPETARAGGSATAGGERHGAGAADRGPPVGGTRTRTHRTRTHRTRTRRTRTRWSRDRRAPARRSRAARARGSRSRRTRARRPRTRRTRGTCSTRRTRRARPGRSRERCPGTRRPRTRGTRARGTRDAGRARGGPRAASRGRAALRRQDRRDRPAGRTA